VAIVGLLMLLIMVVLIIIEIFWLVQLTEAAINFIGDGSGFFSTGNFLAWIVAFILLAIVAGLVSFLFRWLDALAILALGSLFSIGRREVSLGSLVVGYRLVWLFWICASVGLTSLVMGYFAEHPELNSFMAEGGWLATVLTYLGIMGLVFPTNSNSN